MIAKNKIKKLVQGRVSTALFVFDVLSVSAAFSFSLFISNFLQEYFISNVIGNTYDFLSLIICPAILTLFYIKGHYTQRVPWWTQVRYVFGICLIMFVSDVFVRLILDLPLSEFFIVVNSIFIFFFILLGRQILCALLSKIGVWKIDTIVIADAEAAEDILYAFHADYYAGYNVITIVLRDNNGQKFDIESVPRDYVGINVVYDNRNYKEFIEKNSDSFFVISLETFKGEERDSLAKYLTNRNVLYSVAPPVSSMRLFEMRPHNFFGYDLMLLHAKNVTPSFFKRFVKRAMDVVGAGSALILFSPVILLVMAGLKLEGQGGSVFYGGNRIGRGGALFKCWKFRSMMPESDHLLHELIDSDPAIKEDWLKYRKLKVQDPRVTTKTAHIIRKTSIDELPQLWNVLKGDMSLVGPRPILPNEKELLETSYDNYIKVPPGITGLWQVSGRNDTTFKRRIHMDNWYVRNWSIWGDIVIIIKTLKVVLKGSGSY